MRGVLYWLIAHAQAVVTGLAAIAAGFSALSSFLIMRVQWANLLESVRPELVLLDWHRVQARDASDSETIAFRRVRNAGRGVALFVRLHLSDHSDPPPANMGTMLLSLIEAAGDVPADGTIHVWFKNAPTFGQERNKIISVIVDVTCWDTRGNFYETVNTVTVVQTGSLPNEIARGVEVHRAPATMTTARRMRLRAHRNRLLIKLGRLPAVFGGLFVRHP